MTELEYFKKVLDIVGLGGRIFTDLMDGNTYLVTYFFHENEEQEDRRVMLIFNEEGTYLHAVREK